MTAAVPLSWRPRAVPLAPAAVVASRPVAALLALRLLQRDDEALRRLQGVAGPGLLVLLGEADALPWVDGVGYLGTDPRAPGLLLPTHLEPSVHPQLLREALLRRKGTQPSGLLAVLPAQGRVVPLWEAKPVERARLEAWVGRGA